MLLMFLSQLTLNLAAAAVRRDLASAYETHRTLVRLVAVDADSAPGRLLWRQERAESGEPPQLLVQTEIEPLLANLPDGYVADAATKSWEPSVAAGTLLQLRVRACPEVTRDGKRRPLRGIEEQIAWMQRQAAVNLGLEVLQCGVTGTGEIHSSRRAGGQIIATAAQFEGVVRVADPDQLAAGIRSGIGHSKLLGLGLVSIARVQ